MPLADVQLSILAFPQRWTGAALETRMLLLPAGDPTIAPSPPLGLPRFAGTTWSLRAMVVPALDALVGPSRGAAPARIPVTLPPAAPASSLALFNAIGAQFPIVPPDPPAVRRTRFANIAFRKHLPASYTNAFAFERPGSGTTIGNEFG